MMKMHKTIVSSRNRKGTISSTIIVQHNGTQKELAAIMFSNVEAKILDSYIDKLKK